MGIYWNYIIIIICILAILNGIYHLIIKKDDANSETNYRMRYYILIIIFACFLIGQRILGI